MGFAFIEGYSDGEACKLKKYLPVPLFDFP